MSYDEIKAAQLRQEAWDLMDQAADANDPNQARRLRQAAARKEREANETRRALKKAA